MIEAFSETVILSLVGLLLLALLSAAMATKSWRAMKKSPYFFMRLQAEKRFQRYSFVSLALFALMGVTAVYATQIPHNDNIPRVAILTNSKPPTEEVVKIIDRTETSEFVIHEETAGALSVDTISTEKDEATSRLSIPPEYDQVEPVVDLQANTALGKIEFSTEINDEYEAVDPSTLFGEGFYTLYATFSYDDMADGMAWSWVWRRDGEVVEGGNELWAYGDEGPGYIYLSPEEGFQNGEYTLDVWVNGEKLTQSAAIMNQAAISAGN